MRRFFILMGSCVFLLTGCNRSSQKYDKAYFDFDSLISVQVADLIKSEVTINKRSVINGKNDNSSFVPDSLKLAHELDVFRQLDLINKPLFRNAYEIKDGEKDNKSNLLIRSYTAKSPSPVAYVKFYYTSSPRELKKIESVFHDKNSLYDTRRNLILEFDDSSGSILLSRYQLSGAQKMILSDAVNFSVDVSFSSGID
jgi:hypothetical protein